MIAKNVSKYINKPNRCCTVYDGIDLSKFENVKPVDIRKEFALPADAIIVGTGQAGPSLAGRLAAAGMNVAIIERKFFGGMSCLFGLWNLNVNANQFSGCVATEDGSIT